MAVKNVKKKPVTAKQAQLAVALMKANKGKKNVPVGTMSKVATPKKVVPMDPEDKLDGGIDEDEEDS